MQYYIIVFIIIDIILLGVSVMGKPVFYSLNKNDFPSKESFDNIESAFIIRHELNWFLMYQMPKYYFEQNHSYNFENIFLLTHDKAKELLCNKAVKSVHYFGG